MYVPTYFWHNFKFKTIWMSNKDFTQIDFTNIFESFHKSDTKKGSWQVSHNVNWIFKSQCQHFALLRNRKEKDTFYRFHFFSQRVPLWATTESKLSKTILGCFFGGAHWPNGRRKRGADARWVLRNTGRKVVKTIWLISRGNDIVNFSVMFIILRIFCGCVGPIQASKV